MILQDKPGSCAHLVKWRGRAPQQGEWKTSSQEQRGFSSTPVDRKTKQDLQTTLCHQMCPRARSGPVFTLKVPLEPSQTVAELRSNKILRSSYSVQWREGWKAWHCLTEVSGWLYLIPRVGDRRRLGGARQFRSYPACAGYDVLRQDVMFSGGLHGFQVRGSCHSHHVCTETSTVPR